MAEVRRHEDLVAWQLCTELDALIFEATSKGPGARDFEWLDQIRGSSGSAAPNIAEGFGRFGPREFARYLRIAIASLKETSTHLVLGKGRGYLVDPTYARQAALCRAATDITTRLLNAKLRQIAKEEAERAKKKRRKSNPNRKPTGDGQ
jgi:four helix bundle protein